MKRYFKNLQEDKMINMIMVMGNINGLIKIYHNETSCSSPSQTPRHNKKLNRITSWSWISKNEKVSINVWI